MSDTWCIVMLIFITAIGMTCMITKDVKAWRRKAPDGKVFVRDFMQMIEDIETALTHSKKDNVEATISGNFKFKVRVSKEVPYVGLEFETIPMYKSHGVYINDELVCRAHIIRGYCKNNIFIEFSSKRKRDEVIDIIKRAQKVANEYIYENAVNWISKYDSKSFYSEDKK